MQKSKLKVKHLKVPGNRKVFKGLRKEKKLYKKTHTKPVKKDTEYIKRYSKY